MTRISGVFFAGNSPLGYHSSSLLNISCRIVHAPIVKFNLKLSHFTRSKNASSLWSSFSKLNKNFAIAVVTFTLCASNFSTVLQFPSCKNRPFKFGRVDTACPIRKKKYKRKKKLPHGVSAAIEQVSTRPLLLLKLSVCVISSSSHHARSLPTQPKWAPRF